MFGIRYSYSDNYYATDGDDRGCTGSRSGTLTFKGDVGIIVIQTSEIGNYITNEELKK
jgi:hypothetical protein